MSTTRYDLLIKGGTVVDPSQGLHAVRDVALSDGKVAAVEEGISESLAGEVLDATGLIVTPGLIDLHVHAWWGASAYSIQPDPVHVAKGVTTVLDAGSSGARTFAGFRHYVIDRVRTRVFALLNISSMGMIADFGIGELEDIRWAEVDRAVDVARSNRDRVLGIKVRLGRLMAGGNDVGAVTRAIEAAEAIGGFVMAHVGNSNSPIEDLAAMLRPGDVVTHAFHGIEDRIVDGSGRVREGVAEAQRRGVVFDVGHGMGGFSFDTAHKAVSQGFLPDNISTDLHMYSVEGPVFDLLTTLSKFMHLGMSLDEVIRRSTESTARIMGLGDGLGTLGTGATGDVSILRLEEGRFTLTDRLTEARSIAGMDWAAPISVEATSMLTHVKTVAAGRIYRPWEGAWTRGMAEARRLFRR